MEMKLGEVIPRSSFINLYPLKLHFCVTAPCRLYGIMKCLLNFQENGSICLGITTLHFTFGVCALFTFPLITQVEERKPNGRQTRGKVCFFFSL